MLFFSSLRMANQPHASVAHRCVRDFGSPSKTGGRQHSKDRVPTLTARSILRSESSRRILPTVCGWCHSAHYKQDSFSSHAHSRNCRPPTRRATVQSTRVASAQGPPPRHSGSSFFRSSVMALLLRASAAHRFSDPPRRLSLEVEWPSPEVNRLLSRNRRPVWDGIAFCTLVAASLWNTISTWFCKTTSSHRRQMNSSTCAVAHLLASSPSPCSRRTSPRTPTHPSSRVIRSAMKRTVRL